MTKVHLLNDPKFQATLTSHLIGLHPTISRVEISSRREWNFSFPAETSRTETEVTKGSDVDDVQGIDDGSEVVVPVQRSRKEVDCIISICSIFYTRSTESCPIFLGPLLFFMRRQRNQKTLQSQIDYVVDRNWDIITRRCLNLTWTFGSLFRFKSLSLVDQKKTKKLKIFVKKNLVRIETKEYNLFPNVQ